MRSAIQARASALDPTIGEHDVVQLSGTFGTSSGSLPKGSIGTVVGIWAEGELFEVEFTDPVQTVVTVPAMALSRITHGA